MRVDDLFSPYIRKVECIMIKRSWLFLLSILLTSSLHSGERTGKFVFATNCDSHLTIKYPAPKVLTPVAIPPGGTTFSSLSTGVDVTLTTATVGATICYTLTGVDPDSTCSNAITYTGAIYIAQTTTLKARAVLTGWIPSDILVAVYTEVDPGRVATPVANPPGTTFVFPLSVTLSTATTGATICYTTNSIDPDSTCSNATPYVGPINIAVTTTLKARAILTGRYPSAIMVEVYSKVATTIRTKVFKTEEPSTSLDRKIFFESLRGKRNRIKIR